MRPKTIVMFILAVLLALLVWQLVSSLNTTLKFSGSTRKDMILAAVVVAFVLGYLIGLPSARHGFNRHYVSDEEYTNPDTLSEEDRDYIN